MFYFSFRLWELQSNNFFRPTNLIFFSEKCLRRYLRDEPIMGYSYKANGRLEPKLAMVLIHTYLRTNIYQAVCRIQTYPKLQKGDPGRPYAGQDHLKILRIEPKFLKSMPTVSRVACQTCVPTLTRILGGLLLVVWLSVQTMRSQQHKLKPMFSTTTKSRKCAPTLRKLSQKFFLLTLHVPDKISILEITQNLGMSFAENLEFVHVRCIGNLITSGHLCALRSATTVLLS